MERLARPEPFLAIRSQISGAVAWCSFEPRLPGGAVGQVEVGVVDGHVRDPRLF